MTDDDPITATPELLTEIAIRAFARAKDEAIRENDRLGIPSYGGKDGQIVVRQPPPHHHKRSRTTPMLYEIKEAVPHPDHTVTVTWSDGAHAEVSFEPLVPNKETIEAMKAAERGEVTTVGHPRKLLESLNADGFLTLGDLARDPWSVLRGLLPPNADVALLLAAREATYRALDRIMAVERRDGLNEVTAWLLELARLSAIGRLAMLDNWRSQLTGAAFGITRPYGEDTDYARARRLRPEKLAEIIAIVDDEPPKPRS